jgi:hypothetical protein
VSQMADVSPGATRNLRHSYQTLSTHLIQAQPEAFEHISHRADVKVLLQMVEGVLRHRAYMFSGNL